MRADIVVGAVFPDYELTDHTGKRRKPSDLQGPDDPGAQPRRVLPKGSSPGRESGPTSPRNGSRLLPARHHKHGQHASDKRVPNWRWRSLDLLVRSGTQGSKGSRNCRIHGPRAQSHDPARHRTRTWSRNIQDLQRLLVFWPGDRRRAPVELTSGSDEVLPGLGHHQALTESRL